MLLNFLNENKTMQVHVNIFIIENILNQAGPIVFDVGKSGENVRRTGEGELEYQDCRKMEEGDDCCCCCCSSEKEGNVCEGILYK